MQLHEYVKRTFGSTMAQFYWFTWQMEIGLDFPSIFWRIWSATSLSLIHASQSFGHSSQVTRTSQTHFSVNLHVLTRSDFTWPDTQTHRLTLTHTYVEFRVFFQRVQKIAWLFVYTGISWNSSTEIHIEFPFCKIITAIVHRVYHQTYCAKTKYQEAHKLNYIVP